MKAPSGRSEVYRVFGNPTRKDFEASKLVMVALPLPMYASWQPSIRVDRVRVHELLGRTLSETLMAVWNEARIRTKKAIGPVPNLSGSELTRYYDEKTRQYLKNLGLDQFGGGYVYRKVVGGKLLSMHSWGIAIDINPARNALGTAGTMPDWYVKIWEDRGWTWGGRFSRKDPMHFQFASGC